MRKIFLWVLLATSFSVRGQGPFCTLPASYYKGIVGLQCNELKAALFNIISANHLVQSNSSLWSIFEKTDIHRDDLDTKDVVWDMYTDKPHSSGDCEFLFGTNQDVGTGGNAECQFYNKEHSMPNSWFGAATLSPMYTDLFEMYPTDKYLNNVHASYPYGEVNIGAGGAIVSANGSKFGTSKIAGIPGKVFEPIDDYKGDFARSFFYMATRYHDVIATWDKLDPSGDLALDGLQYPSFEIPYLKMLLNWHHLDPVSQKEIDRNNTIFCIQKNRNPYIDMPELVDLVWNPTCPGAEALPVDIVFFTGVLSGNEVKLNWEAANEKDLQSYIVERSVNGMDFIPAGQVFAANRGRYNYTDNISNVAGQEVYYRLKQVDKNGQYKYSYIFAIQVPLNILFTVYPNPVSTNMMLHLSKPVSNAALLVLDMAGRVHLIKKISNVSGAVPVYVGKLSTGSYIVKMLYEGQQSQTRLEVIR